MKIRIVDCASPILQGFAWGIVAHPSSNIFQDNTDASGLLVCEIDAVGYLQHALLGAA